MRCERVAALPAMAMIFSLTTAVHAAPLDLKHVSADAKWLGHVDADALRSSAVVKQMVAKVKEKHPQVEGHLEIAKQLSGMDLCKDIQGVTLYGSKIGKHTGVAIVHGKFDVDRLQGWAQRMPRRETTKYGDYDISIWTHKHHGQSHTMATTFHGKSHLVAASSVDLLKSALDVLDGKRDSASTDGPLAGNIPAGTTVLFRVTDLSKAELPCKDPVIKQTESFRFVMGESDGKSFYKSRTKMTNEEMVDQLDRVIEGLKALGQLHFAGNDRDKKIVSNLQSNGEGKTLTVLWSAPASDVWTSIEAHAKKFEEMRAKHRKQHRNHHHGHDDDHGHDSNKKSESKKSRSSDEDF